MWVFISIGIKKVIAFYDADIDSSILFRGKNNIISNLYFVTEPIQHANAICNIAFFCIRIYFGIPLSDCVTIRFECEKITDFFPTNCNDRFLQEQIIIQRMDSPNVFFLICNNHAVSP